MVIKIHNINILQKINRPLEASRSSYHSRLNESEILNNGKQNINIVPQYVVTNFLNNWKQIFDVFNNPKLSIDSLVNKGGIQLKYSRQDFKTNIFSKINRLSTTEQTAVLAKFGLERKEADTLAGLPIRLETKQNLTPLEASVNNEIEKFYSQNQIILPNGFESFQGSLESICRTFPEFIFTIGAKQHHAHKNTLAEHMLKTLQENMKNPLYKTLNDSDKKVLSIATLLHDINKTEGHVDPEHPEASAKTATAIVKRMDGLTDIDKKRIVNFVKNHHWLMKVSNGCWYDSSKAEDIAHTFRYGNDFKMAKIFAESDLKAVNPFFYELYGSKINSPMTKAIEEKIAILQRR